MPEAPALHQSQARKPKRRAELHQLGVGSTPTFFVNDRMAESCKTLKDELSLIDRIDSVHLIIQRGQELLELELKLSDGT